MFFKRNHGRHFRRIIVALACDSDFSSKPSIGRDSFACKQASTLAPPATSPWAQHLACFVAPRDLPRTRHFVRFSTSTRSFTRFVSPTRHFVRFVSPTRPSPPPDEAFHLPSTLHLYYLVRLRTRFGSFYEIAWMSCGFRRRLFQNSRSERE